MLSIFRLCHRSNIGLRYFSKNVLTKKVPLIEEISLCVTGNGADGNPRSVFLEYNDKVYMFNCGEGTQRRLADYGFKPSKLEHLLITSPNFHNFCGISSVLLARIDTKNYHLVVSGLNSENLIKECTCFDTKLRRVKFEYPNLSDELKYNNLTIKPFVIGSNAAKPNSQSVIYACTLAPQKGVIDLDKCFYAKVPKNLVSNLLRGEDVTLESGEIITPERVYTPNEPEKKFVMFECLSSETLRSVEKNPVLMEFFLNSDMVVHFANEHILKTKGYQQFLKALKQAHNLILSEANQSLSMYSLHRYHRQLNLIDSKIFPPLSEEKAYRENETTTTIDCPEFNRCLSGSTFQLRPSISASGEKTLTHYDRFQKINMEDVLLHKDGSSRPGIEKVLDELKDKQAKLIVRGQSYPEFVFLGTCSSMSLPIRNVPGILVNLSPEESIILDCGENTYGQLLRFYGSEKTAQIMQRLKAIFVTHHHSDHHMGLIQLIQKHYQLTGNRIAIIIPPMLNKFLHNMIDVQNQSLTRLFKSVKSLNLFPVMHCVYAFGIHIQTNDGFRFVYSGDTRPCDELVSAAKNCDLLIHEATIESSLLEFAETNFHTTYGEALEIAKQSQAKFTILTHFSQRYGKLPLIPEGLDNVFIAFDNMIICPDDFERLILMKEPLKCMYSKHLENVEYRSSVYAQKWHNPNEV